MLIPPLSSTHKPTTPSSTLNTHITSPAATAHGNAPTTNTYHMVTRAKAGISKPLARMNCHATTTSPIPRSYLHALCDPNWHKTMVDEYNALISNGTWFVEQYKSTIVCKWTSVKSKDDCDETFSPVVKPATIRTVLSLAVTRDWPIHQLDVKNAFLHGLLSETVYMHQPPGFVDSAHPLIMFVTCKNHYIVKRYITIFIIGFWMLHLLLLYVDDIILTASSTALLQRIITLLHKEILKHAHMQHCNPCKTPVDTESKLGSDGDPLILRYVRGTTDHGLQLHVSSTSQLTAYTDADWAGCPVTRRILLLDFKAPLSTATLVYYDNVSAVYLSTNPVQHQRTKHIEIDIHFVREYVASGQVRMLHVPSRFQSKNSRSLDHEVRLIHSFELSGDHPRS
ncbi:ribonuclease H-like domain-containing protein [Tanacetum coccineum]